MVGVSRRNTGRAGTTPQLRELGGGGGRHIALASQVYAQAIRVTSDTEYTFGGDSADWGIRYDARAEHYDVVDDRDRKNIVRITGLSQGKKKAQQAAHRELTDTGDTPDKAQAQGTAEVNDMDTGGRKERSGGTTWVATTNEG